MRKLLIIIMTVVCASAYAQSLYTSYEKNGTVNAAGGANVYHVDIKLNKDGSFVCHTTVFASVQNMITALSEDVNFGKWFLKYDTLVLDCDPESADAKKQYDIYLIRRKKMKRITSQGEKTFFRASGEILLKE